MNLLRRLGDGSGPKRRTAIEAMRQEVEEGGGVADAQDSREILAHLSTEKLADTICFCAVQMVETMANVIFLAVEVDNKCRHHCLAQDFVIWNHIDTAFCAVEVALILVAISSHGIFSYFIRSVGKSEAKDQKPRTVMQRLRTADFFAVILRVVDVFLIRNTGAGMGLRYLASLRVFYHMVRLSGTLKKFNTFRELALFLEGFRESMKSVFWVVLILLLMIYIFATILVINLGGSTDAADELKYDSALWGSYDYWGTLANSMLSLFQVVTKDQWSSQLTRPIMEQGGWLIFVFIIFIVLTNLACLSTIIGVIVESSLRNAKLNSEKQAQIEVHNMHDMQQKLTAIFKVPDMTPTSRMSRADMHAVLRRHGAKKRIRRCGICPGDLDLLFTLLDAHGTDDVVILTFIRACQRLTGTARARDLTRLHNDVFRYLDWVEKTDAEVSNLNSSIGQVLDTCDTINLEVFVAEADSKDPMLVATRAAARYHKSDILCRSPTAKKREPTPTPSRTSSKSSGGGSALRDRRAGRRTSTESACLLPKGRSRLSKVNSNSHRLFLTRAEMSPNTERRSPSAEAARQPSLDGLRQPDPPPLPPGLVDFAIIAEAQRKSVMT